MHLSPPRRRPRPIPAGSLTCPSARRWTRCRGWWRMRSSRRRDSPGYPAAAGTPALRAAAAGWLARNHQVTVDPAAVLPVIGTKELIASLPTLLGCGPGDLVTYPALAYPTYRRRRAAGRRPAGRRGRDARPLGPEQVRLAWLNSPSNPTGQVLPAEHLRKVGELGQGAGHDRRVGRVLPRIRLGRHAGFGAAPGRLRRIPPGPARRALAVQAVQPGRLPGGLRHRRPGSSSAELLEIRKHAGLLMPAPVQAAMAAALNDDEHAAVQRARYAARRARLRPALESAGWQVAAFRGRAVPVGGAPGARLLGVGTRARRGGHPGRAGRALRAGRAPARPGGAHRHRRADRRRRIAAGGAGLSARAGAH